MNWQDLKKDFDKTLKGKDTKATCESFLKCVDFVLAEVEKGEKEIARKNKVEGLKLAQDNTLLCAQLNAMHKRLQPQLWDDEKFGKRLKILAKKFAGTLLSKKFKHTENALSAKEKKEFKSDLKGLQVMYKRPTLIYQALQECLEVVKGFQKECGSGGCNAVKNRLEDKEGLNLYNLFDAYVCDYEKQASSALLEFIKIAINTIGVCEKNKEFGVKDINKVKNDIGKLGLYLSDLSCNTSSFPIKENVLHVSDVEFGKFIFLSEDLKSKCLSPCYEILKRIVANKSNLEKTAKTLLKNKLIAGRLDKLIIQRGLKIEGDMPTFIAGLIEKFVENINTNIEHSNKIKEDTERSKEVDLIKKIHIIDNFMFLLQKNLQKNGTVLLTESKGLDWFYKFCSDLKAWLGFFECTEKQLIDEIKSITLDKIKDPARLEDLFKQRGSFNPNLFPQAKENLSKAITNFEVFILSNKTSLTAETFNKKITLFTDRETYFYLVDPQTHCIISSDDQLPPIFESDKRWRLFKSNNDKSSEEIKNLIFNNKNLKSFKNKKLINQLGAKITSYTNANVLYNDFVKNLEGLSQLFVTSSKELSGVAKQKREAIKNKVPDVIIKKEEKKESVQNPALNQNKNVVKPNQKEKSEEKKTVVKKIIKQDEIIKPKRINKLSDEEHKNHPVYSAFYEAKDVIDEFNKTPSEPPIPGFFIYYCLQQFEGKEITLDSLCKMFDKYGKGYKKPSLTTLSKFMEILLNTLGVYEKSGGFGLQLISAATKQIDSIKTIDKELYFLAQNTSHFPTEKGHIDIENIKTGDIVFYSKDLLDKFLIPFNEAVKDIITTKLKIYNRTFSQLNKVLNDFITNGVIQITLFVVMKFYGTKIEKKKGGYYGLASSVIGKFFEKIGSTITTCKEYLDGRDKFSEYQFQVGANSKKTVGDVIEGMHVFQSLISLLQNYLTGNEEAVPTIKPEGIDEIHRLCGSLDTFHKIIEKIGKELTGHINLVFEQGVITDPKDLGDFHKRCKDFIENIEKVQKKFDSGNFSKTKEVLLKFDKITPKNFIENVNHLVSSLSTVNKETLAAIKTQPKKVEDLIPRNVVIEPKIEEPGSNISNKTSTNLIRVLLKVQENNASNNTHINVEFNYEGKDKSKSIEKQNEEVIPKEEVVSKTEIKRPQQIDNGSSKFWRRFFISMALVILGLAAVFAAAISATLLILIWQYTTAAMITASILAACAILFFALDLGFTRMKFIRKSTAETAAMINSGLSYIPVYENWVSGLVTYGFIERIRPTDDPSGENNILEDSAYESSGMTPNG